jgi:hypothetical protein
MAAPTRTRTTPRLLKMLPSGPSSRSYKNQSHCRKTAIYSFPFSLWFPCWDCLVPMPMKCYVYRRGASYTCLGTQTEPKRIQTSAYANALIPSISHSRNPILMRAILPRERDSDTRTGTSPLNPDEHPVDLVKRPPQGLCVDNFQVLQRFVN